MYICDTNEEKKEALTKQRKRDKPMFTLRFKNAPCDTGLNAIQQNTHTRRKTENV